MKAFIAYKFTHVPDKVTLQDDLIYFSGVLSGLGYQTFILGRDVKHWGKTFVPSFKVLPKIIFNMFKSDVVFAFVTSEAKSPGLLFELNLARFLRKKTILVLKTGLNPGFLSKLVSFTVLFEKREDLASLLKPLL